MKAISSVFTILSIAGLGLTVVACGSGNNNSSTAAGTVVAGTGCVYTQLGLLPQGSCPAGQGQIITMANGVNAGYTQGQCLPQVAANNGVYGNTGVYPNQGVYPGYNNGAYPGYPNTGAYGSTGYDGGQCANQAGGLNGINNGQCVQTQFGCLPQCALAGQPGGLQYQGNCAAYSYYGVTYPGAYQPGVGLPGVAPVTPYGYGPYAPGYYNGGYVPGGGGNFGGFYYYRGI
jgi:hypothetical protein